MLELQERPDPEAGPGQVLIQVASAGVNFADVHATRGQYAGSPPPPFVPGLEVAGREAGTGRPLLALLPAGGYAELAVADRRFVFEADGLDLEVAGAFLLVTLTAFFALEEVARVRPDERVLVTAAAGGLGSASIQMAKALGAGRIIGVASSPEKRRAALAAGADEAIGYDDPVPPVDLVVDGVGGPLSRRWLEATRHLGRLLLLGRSSGEPPPIPDFGELRQRNVAVCCFSFGALRAADPDRVAEKAGAGVELLRSGRVRPPVGRRLPLANAAEAHRLLAGRQSIGKLVLNP